jgi:coenzyme F420-reducing hydrogenase delta subunit
MTFEPKILGFLCNWCAYAGADLAGVSRVQYPPNMRVIRVMCSGRVDPLHVLGAFRNGMEGVAVLGCHPGDCHYLTGNYQAERKMDMTVRILERVGIDPDRLLLDWVSAAEGQRFGEVITKFTERIRELGPLDMADAGPRAAVGEKIASMDRIRWLVGKERDMLDHGNVYGDDVDEAELMDILWNDIVNEYNRELIRSAVGKQAPATVAAIAEAVEMDASIVFKYMLDLENAGQVNMMDIVDDTPRYILVGEVER